MEAVAFDLCFGQYKRDACEIERIKTLRQSINKWEKFYSVKKREKWLTSGKLLYLCGSVVFSCKARVELCKPKTVFQL